MSHEEMVVARAIDPVGWAWYDQAEETHIARPRFYQHAQERAARAIKALDEDRKSKP